MLRGRTACKVVGRFYPFTKIYPLGWFQPQLGQETKIIACSAHSTASRGPSGTGPSSAIMSDAVTSVGAIRAGDTITYIDHFGGDSEGPVSTAILLLHKGTQVKTFTLSKLLLPHSVHATECGRSYSLHEICSPVYLCCKQAQRGRRAPVRLQR